MICKNCKTSVDDNDKVCKNCGARLDNSRRWGILAVVLIAAALIYIFFIQGGNNKQPDIIATIESEEPTESQEPEVSPEPARTPEPEIVEEPLPISEANLEMPIDEVWVMVDEVINNINEFYEKYALTVTYLSKNGYLFEDPSKSYIFIEDLEGLVEVDENYKQESIMFFYLKPVDLKEFESLKVTSGEDFKIFAGYETKEGFAITADGEQGGIIAREDLSSLLDKYSWDHGDERKIAFESNDFAQVIKAVSGYANITTGFDVRYMAGNDKYVAVVASPKDKPNQINQYVLEYTGDIYTVKVGNLEAFENYKVAVNAVLPDFNMNLLPNYDLNTNLKYLNNDFGNIQEAMMNGSLIVQSDMPVTFQCGTNEFVYFEFSSGKHFVGNLENDTWKMYPIDSYESAVDLMKSISNKPPLYILKQY